MSLFFSLIPFKVMTEAQLAGADQLLLCKCSQYEWIRCLLVTMMNFLFVNGSLRLPRGINIHDIFIRDRMP